MELIFKTDKSGHTMFKTGASSSVFPSLPDVVAWTKEITQQNKSIYLWVRLTLT
jgi:hypothetical protein